MTDKQYEEYKKAKEELEPVKKIFVLVWRKRVYSQAYSLFKTFLAWC